ncbi:MAG TPA: flagellar basal body rod protein FlgB [Sumerlaeia bacterium]|nr:flagellar basal body rod protein FlgB [Sumerlaeia bacterium]
MIEAVFDRTVQVLEKAIMLRQMRHALLASNIANAETPSYRAVDIDFKATMERLLEKAQEVEAAPLELEANDPRHFTIEELRHPGEEREQIVFAAGDGLSIGNDNNSVALEQQLGRMQANSTLHSALAQLLNWKLGGIKDAIESSARSR